MPDAFRQQLAASAAGALAQFTQSQAFVAAAEASFAPARKQMLAMAEQAFRDIAPFQEQMRLSLEARSTFGGTGTTTDSVTMRVSTSRATKAAVPAVEVDVAEDGDVMEDMYRLVGAVSLQLDDLLQGRPATAVELYNAVMATLALLVALLVQLAPHTV